MGGKQNAIQISLALWITVDLHQTTEALAGAEPGGGVPRHIGNANGSAEQGMSRQKKIDMYDFYPTANGDITSQTL